MQRSCATKNCCCSAQETAFVIRCCRRAPALRARGPAICNRRSRASRSKQSARWSRPVSALRCCRRQLPKASRRPIPSLPYDRSARHSPHAASRSRGERVSAAPSRRTRAQCSARLQGAGSDDVGARDCDQLGCSRLCCLPRDTVHYNVAWLSPVVASVKA